MKKYRKNVVGIFINDEKKVLVFERSDMKGAWQFPQGGVEDGESTRDALQREMLEETGIKKFHIILESKHEIQYDFPIEMNSNIAKNYAGQSQTWFLLALDKNISPDLKNADGEFSDWKWVAPDHAITLIVDWKKEAYTKGLIELKLIGEQ